MRFPPIILSIVAGLFSFREVPTFCGCAELLPFRLGFRGGLLSWRKAWCFDVHVHPFLPTVAAELFCRQKNKNPRDSARKRSTKCVCLQPCSCEYTIHVCLFFAYIYQRNQPSIGKNIIHGWLWVPLGEDLCLVSELGDVNRFNRKKTKKIF